MIRSMTAYGRGEVAGPVGHLTVEIISINRKGLEQMVTLPKELWQLEVDVKKWVAEKLARGKVTIRISLTCDQNTAVSIQPNIAYAKELKKSWEEIAEALGVQESVSLQLLARDPGVLQFSQKEFQGEFRSCLKRAVEEALTHLLTMKETEGKALFEDLLPRVQKIRQEVAHIAEHTHDATRRLRDRLKERVEEALPGVLDNDERILREIVVFAEKADITEEITRLRSHLAQLEETLQNNEEICGKKMEFIVLEMMREINTTGAKTSEIAIAEHVVSVKTELERIREQLANVE